MSNKIVDRNPENASVNESSSAVSNEDPLIISTQPTEKSKIGNDDTKNLAYDDETEEEITTIIRPKDGFEKYCSPLNPGSFRSSVFIFMSMMIGLGCLSLPFAFMEFGIVLGIAFLTYGAFLGVWSNLVIVRCSYKRNILNYQDLVTDILGEGAGQIFKGFFLFYIFGSVINFQIGILDIFAKLLEILEVSIKIIDNFWLQITVTGIVNFIIFWVARKRKLGDYRLFSVASYFNFLYIILVFLAKAPGLIAKNDYSQFQIFSPQLNIFSAYSVTAYSFFTQSITLDLRKELKMPSKYRMYKLIKTGFFFNYILYLIIASVGYISCLNNTPQLFPGKEPFDSVTDYLIDIGRYLFFLNFAYCICVRVKSLRDIVISSLKKPNTQGNHDLLTIYILTITGFLSVIFPDLYFAITIIGGIGATFLSYVFPGLMFLKDFPNETLFRRTLAYLIIVVSVVMGIFSVLIETLIQFGKISPE